jgi:hypothetical protein
MISRTWNRTIATNTTRRGKMAASDKDRIFFDLREEAEIISLDDKSAIRRTAINAPPTPPLTAAVIDTVLVAVATIVITKLIASLFQK